MKTGLLAPKLRTAWAKLGRTKLSRIAVDWGPTCFQLDLTNLDPTWRNLGSFEHGAAWVCVGATVAQAVPNTGPLGNVNKSLRAARLTVHGNGCVSC